ncbi:MAG: hypothetical protein ACP5LE_03870 [Thermoplasmata archaeon]
MKTSTEKYQRIVKKSRLFFIHLLTLAIILIISDLTWWVGPGSITLNFLALAFIVGSYCSIQTCLETNKFRTFKSYYVYSSTLGIGGVIAMIYNIGWLLSVLLDGDSFHYYHNNIFFKSLAVIDFIIWLTGTLFLFSTLFSVKKYGNEIEYFREEIYFKGVAKKDIQLMKIFTILFGIIYSHFFLFLMGEELQAMYHAGIICVPMGMVYLILFILMIIYLYTAYYIPDFPVFYRRYKTLLIFIIIFIIISSIIFVEDLVFYISHNGMMEFCGGVGSCELRPDDTMPITIILYFTSLTLFFLMIFYGIKFINRWRDKT